MSARRRRLGRFMTRRALSGEYVVNTRARELVDQLWSSLNWIDLRRAS